MTWRTTERQWSVDIDFDLISFWIHPVNLICERLVTLLHLELKVNDIQVESFDDLISLPFEVGLPNAVAELFSTSDLLEGGIVQVGLGVAGLSSSGNGFHQSCLESAFSRLAFPKFSSSDTCTCSSGMKSSSIRDSIRNKSWASKTPADSYRVSNVEEEEVAATEKTKMLPKYLEHQMRPLEEVVVVAIKVETQEEFLVRGGGGRVVVVVMMIEVVAMDVGSGELDSIVVRSIIGVVIGGTKEVS
ncbi:hypothetical protein Tco_0891919 [Tanacetum coccineum]|uniref:DUF4283 domain-containing protein n=1 Tax=Tanacetum coccineum TaxID=301880 RepID=A0ABQ5C698_9ASTR